MALGTAIAMFALGWGIVFARPDEGFVSLFIGDDPGGVLARRILPPAVLLPMAFGLVVISGERRGFMSFDLMISIAVVVGDFVIAALIAFTARSLMIADRARRTSERYSRAQYLTTRVLVDSGTMEEAIPRVLQAVCESLEWDVESAGGWTRRADSRVGRSGSRPSSRTCSTSAVPRLTRDRPAGSGLELGTRLDRRRRPGSQLPRAPAALSRGCTAFAPDHGPAVSA
jgi:hypothetical protein